MTTKGAPRTSEVGDDGRVAWGAQIAGRIHPHHRESIEAAIQRLICLHDCRKDGSCNLLTFGSMTDPDNEAVFAWFIDPEQAEVNKIMRDYAKPDPSPGDRP